MAETVAQVNPFAAPELAAGYDAWFDDPLGALMDRLERQLVLSMARPRAGERALDVGTGTGHFARLLAAAGAAVVGYDSSPAMLAVARGASGAEETITWQQGQAEALPFADGAFQLVLSVTALEFMAQPQQALDEMYRVTAPGGRLVVATLNAAGPWGQLYADQARADLPPFNAAHLWTAAQLAAALGRYGRVRWNSAGHVAPDGRVPLICSLRGGPRLAWPGEWCSRALRRDQGALLVGRVNK